LKLSSLKLELNRARKTVSELDQKLGTARNQLAAAEKKLDRLRCETTVAVPGVKEAAVKQEPNSAEMKMEEDPAGLMRLKMELAAATAQAESRMKAIQQLEQDKKRLQEELQENLTKPRGGADDKPDPERDFHAQITLAKTEMNEARSTAERLSKEIEELRAGGIKLRKQIEVGRRGC
jgi:chromosome segregation ATPase